MHFLKVNISHGGNVYLYDMLSILTQNKKKV